MTATARKYDYATVLERAKQLIREQGLQSVRELADALDMPPSSLYDILRGQGIKDFSGLLAAMKLDDVDDVALLQRQLAHYKKVVKRQKDQLLSRDWLKMEVAGQIAVMEPVEIPPVVPSNAYHEQVAVLQISDAHYGLNISGDSLGVLFRGVNPTIVVNRLHHTFQTFARLAKSQSFPVNKVVVLLEGDLIEHSNMLPVQAKTTSLHVVRQVLELHPHLAAGIRLLCSEFNEVEVYCVPGNHGRATQKAQDSLPDETFEHLLYYMLKIALQDQPNLKVHVPSAWYFIANIFNYKFLILHCEDAFSWAGIPWYGITRLVKDYYMIAGQATKRKLRSMPLTDVLTVGDVLDIINTPDYVCIGHFHNPIDWAIMGVEVHANGSVSGISHYAAKRLHNVTPPAQKMFFVHPEWGVSLRMPINLGNVE